MGNTRMWWGVGGTTGGEVGYGFFISTGLRVGDTDGWNVGKSVGTPSGRLGGGVRVIGVTTGNKAGGKADGITNMVG